MKDPSGLQHRMNAEDRHLLTGRVPPWRPSPTITSVIGPAALCGLTRAPTLLFAVTPQPHARRLLTLGHADERMGLL
jgi:hypothetical protein